MLLSELTIIYLAAAAPFGVARFVEDRERGTRGAGALAKSAAAALAWPLTALLFVLKSVAPRTIGAGACDGGHAHDEQRVERVRRSTVNALREVEDLLLSERGHDCEAGRHVLFAARESVERYAGLALACASAREDAAPAPRELELCRIAGRAGDDLLVAGRCVHRRNVTRLLAHRERARAELIHALAAAREIAHEAAREVAHDVYSSRSQFHSAAQTGDDGVRRISEALLRALSRAVELLSLFDDRDTLVAVARLLDAECARLRRAGSQQADAARAVADEGGETCTTLTVPTAFATPRLQTPTPPRG
jgi:hypothetical protein